MRVATTTAAKTTVATVDATARREIGGISTSRGGVQIRKRAPRISHRVARGGPDGPDFATR
jgi:hypothetical protein